MVGKKSFETRLGIQAAGDTGVHLLALALGLLGLLRLQPDSREG